MRSALALLAALLALGLAAPAAAQQAAEAAATVTVQVEGQAGGGAGARLTVGDPIVFRVEVRHPPDARVELEAAMTNLDPLDAALPEIELAAPGLTIVRWRSAAFAVGAFAVALPPIIVVHGGERELIPLAPQRVEVASVLVEGLSEGRPLTPPQTLEGGSNIAAWIAALLAVGAGFLLARILGVRARRRRAPSPAAAAARAPAAAIPQLSSEAGAAEVCRALALAVRTNLAERYQIPARSLTSAELPGRLAAAGAPAATVQRVRTLLLECDAVTFADQSPPAERLAGYRELALAIIDAEAGPP